MGNYYEMSEKTILMKTTMKIIKVTAILLVAFVVLMGFTRLVSGAVTKSEVKECLKLEREAVEYGRKYFITSWQDDMCRGYGIYINAEVK